MMPVPLLRRPMISRALSWASSSPMPLSRRKRAISPSAVLFRSIFPAAAWSLSARIHDAVADLAGHDLVFLDVFHFLALAEVQLFQRGQGLDEKLVFAADARDLGVAQVDLGQGVAQLLDRGRASAS